MMGFQVEGRRAGLAPPTPLSSQECLGAARRAVRQGKGVRGTDPILLGSLSLDTAAKQPEGLVDVAQTGDGEMSQMEITPS